MFDISWVLQLGVKENIQSQIIYMENLILKFLVLSYIFIKSFLFKCGIGFKDQNGIEFVFRV